MTTDLDCLFCKINAGEIPAKMVLQTDKITAFLDINPQAPTHVLVIHKVHTASLSETEDPQVLLEVMQGVQAVAKKLSLTDYRVAINNGASAGQTVFHLHAHVLAGRKLEWPPG
ncbi:MAG: histidine triad nucleotide-binding protein [Vampirovibrio sp.]|nr:histidine triad nucleotide-binding protein [Vampirovibrio sp.]